MSDYACTATPLASAPPISKLLLSHQLLELAEHADRAGLAQSAGRLLELAHTVCSERPGRTVPRRAPAALRRR